LKITSQLTLQDGPASFPEVTTHTVPHFSRTSLMLAICSAVGILLAVVVGRQRRKQVKAVDLAAAASAVTHTIPTEPLPAD
jgi:ABC-type proline/glycine betaine transport system permease subunit